jgi:antitoxin component YwqK of YwqJK toxin-antitoxin module
MNTFDFIQDEYILDIIKDIHCNIITHLDQTDNSEFFQTNTEQLPNINQENVEQTTHEQLDKYINTHTDVSFAEFEKKIVKQLEDNIDIEESHFEQRITDQDENIILDQQISNLDLNLNNIQDLNVNISQDLNVNNIQDLNVIDGIQDLNVNISQDLNVNNIQDLNLNNMQDLNVNISQDLNVNNIQDLNVIDGIQDLNVIDGIQDLNVNISQDLNVNISQDLNVIDGIQDLHDILQCDPDWNPIDNFDIEQCISELNENNIILNNDQELTILNTQETKIHIDNTEIHMKNVMRDNINLKFKNVNNKSKKEDNIQDSIDNNTKVRYYPNGMKEWYCYWDNNNYYEFLFDENGCITKETVSNVVL